MFRKLVTSLLFVGCAAAPTFASDSTFNHTSVSVGTDSVSVLSANTKRNFLMFQNLHDTQKVWCSFNVAEMQANMGFQVTSTPTVFDMFVDRRTVYCKANGASTPIIIIEGVRD